MQQVILRRVLQTAKEAKPAPPVRKVPTMRSKAGQFVAKVRPAAKRV